MSEFIYNEIPSGLVNGVNKTFTTLYDIESIEELYLGGAPYRDLSFVDNVITLVDAPTTGMVISVDYFKAALDPLEQAGDVELGDILNDIYEKLGEDRGTGPTANVVYPESQFLLQINAGIKRIKNLATYKDKILSYSFNKAKDGVVNGYNATFLDIGTKSYVPSSGISILKDSIVVPYSTYTDGKLNGAPGVVYTGNEKVCVGYKIPVGVKKPSEVIMDGKPLVYADSREFSITAGIYYTIVTMGNGYKYIVLPYTDDERIVTVKYIPTYLDVAVDTDLVDIEYEYFELLSYYALWKVLQLREDDRWQIMEKEYKEMLREFKSYKSRAVDGIRNKIRSNLFTS